MVEFAIGLFVGAILASIIWMANTVPKGDSRSHAFSLYADCVYLGAPKQNCFDKYISGEKP